MLSSLFGQIMSAKEDDKESKEPDYDDDKDQLEEKQEEEAGEIDQGETTTNQVFWTFHLTVIYYQNFQPFNGSHNIFISIAKLS